MMIDVRTVTHYVTSLLCLLLSTELALGEPCIRKICKDSEIEILSRQGVRIEPYNKSRVELSLVKYDLGIFNTKSKFQLQFDFKTRSPDGILFYSRSSHRPYDLLAVVLSEGHLIYKIQCPSLHADILIPTRNMTRLNDNAWHTVSIIVKYRRFGNKGHLEIDNYSSAKLYEVSCDRMSSLVMGGTSEADHGYINSIERLPGHFDGCIRNVRPYTALLSPPKYYAVSICS